jgi:glycosyltransferase involved in cell wall biosynthesis
MAYDSKFSAKNGDIKLHIGCSDSVLYGYENIDRTARGNQIKNFSYLSLPYRDNTVSEVIVSKALSQLKYTNIDLFIKELARVVSNNGILTINFIDINNLMYQLRDNTLSLEQFNDFIFSQQDPPKSFISKQKIYELLKKYQFEIIGFEYEDPSILDDYRCRVKATINKAESKKSIISQPVNQSYTQKSERNIFDGIDFDLPDSQSNEESDFDLDLLNEVISTNKHADTLDLALLAEVMDFQVNDNTFQNSTLNQEQSAASLLDEIMNFNFDEPISKPKNESNLLNDVMNFNFDEPKTAKSENNSLLDEIMNFNFDEPKTAKSENNSLLDEIMNFNFDEPKTAKSENNSLLDEIMNFNFDEPKAYTPKVENKNYNYQNTTNEIKLNDFNTKLNFKPEVATIKPSLNIVWEGSQFVYNPLAMVNREICSKIIESGVANVTIVPFEQDDVNFSKYDTDPALLDNDIRRKKDVSAEIAKLPYTWIRNQFPPKQEPPKGAKWIIMQKSEYSVLNKSFTNVLSNCDEVWTPSFFSRKAIIDSGVDFNKVQVIPNGINPDVFTPYGDKYNLNTSKKLKLLFVGPTSYRKGFDLLFESFTDSFTQDDDICLVIKENSTTGTNEVNITRNLINSKKWQYNSPEIIYIEETLSQKDMASLYRACDVIVSPYRSSSSCVALLEAMACGLPVIASKGGAADDFLEEAFTRFLITETKNIGSFVDGMEMTSNVQILEPSADDLKDALLFLYNNPSNIKSMGIIASSYCRTKWTWKNSVIKILRRLDYLYGSKMSSTAEDILEETFDESAIFGTAEHSYIEKDYDNAVNLYMKAIKGNISDRYKILALHRIAMILVNRGETDAAEEILDSIKNISFNHPDSIYLKVIIEASLSNHNEALNLLSPLMDNWVDFKFSSDLGHNLDDIIVLTADLLFAINDFEAANSLYTTALSINNQNAFACYGTAMCFKQSENYDEAKKMFEFALKLNPDFDEATFQLKELDFKY